MKMTEKDVNKKYQGLVKLAKLVFPSKLNFAVSCNLEILGKEFERIEKEREKLCERFAEKDKDGNPVMADCIVNGVKTQEYKISDADRRELNEEYLALLEAEVDLPIRVVKMEEIEKCETAERYDIPTVAQMSAMAFMLEE